MTGRGVGITSEVRGLGRGWSWEGTLKANCKLAMGRGEIEHGRDEEWQGVTDTEEVLSDFGSGSEKPCEVREVRETGSE